eukprot:4970585-Prymnesium_polylepis.1
MLEPPLVDIEVSCTGGVMSLTLTAKARSEKLRSAYVALVTQCAATLVAAAAAAAGAAGAPDSSGPAFGNDMLVALAASVVGLLAC